MGDIIFSPSHFFENTLLSLSDAIVSNTTRRGRRRAQSTTQTPPRRSTLAMAWSSTSEKWTSE